MACQWYPLQFSNGKAVRSSWHLFHLAFTQCGQTGEMPCLGDSWRFSCSVVHLTSSFCNKRSITLLCSFLGNFPALCHAGKWVECKRVSVWWRWRLFTSRSDCLDFGYSMQQTSDSIVMQDVRTVDPEIDQVDRLSRSFEGGVESSWEKGLKSSRPIESIVWQLSWVEVTEVD